MLCVPRTWPFVFSKTEPTRSYFTFTEATSQPSNLHDSDVSSGFLFQFSIALSGSEHDLDPAHVLPAVAPRRHPEVQRVQGHQRADFLCPLLARLWSSHFQFEPLQISVLYCLSSILRRLWSCCEFECNYTLSIIIITYVYIILYRLCMYDSLSADFMLLGPGRIAIWNYIVRVKLSLTTSCGFPCQYQSTWKGILLQA